MNNIHKKKTGNKDLLRQEGAIDTKNAGRIETLNSY